MTRHGPPCLQDVTFGDLQKPRFSRSPVRLEYLGRVPERLVGIRGCGFAHQSHIGAISVFSFFTEKVSSFSHRFSDIGTIFFRPRSHRFSHIGSVFDTHRCFLVFPSTSATSVTSVTSVHIGSHRFFSTSARRPTSAHIGFYVGHIGTSG